jgi:L-ascorbate metabolism protein UlaG (beta-lactamase superfamily)
METMDKIKWHGQAAVEINNNGQRIFIDPFQLGKTGTADLVLITHSHGDHLSPDDIQAVATESTKFVCPHDCTQKIREAGFSDITPVSPGDTVVTGGTRIIAVPMYNVVKTNYHPRENDWTGFIIDVDGVKVYHAGDTERIPEMKEIACDIAMLPLGQTYTMNSVEEAAAAALDTGAEIAIPIHFGLYEGTQEDALKFKELLAGKMKVIILDPEK